MVITRSTATNAAGEDAAGEDFVFGGGIAAPVYQKPFSVASSYRFFKEYREYERNVKLSNSGQTVQRPLLTLSQLLPEHVRWCLADLYFEDNGDEELAESDLRRGLAQHGECWTGSDIHPNQAVAEVERLLEMRSEPTAVARIDAARARLEEYFENPGVARIFREKRKYIEGSARIITEALVRGRKPQEFKEDVVDALKVTGNWKENPNMVFNLIREQALIWRVVERRDEERRIRGKQGSAVKGGPPPSSPPQQRQRNSKLTCWTCGEVGHRSTACPSGPGSTESGAMPRNLIRARKANSSVLKVRSRRRVLPLLGEVLSKHQVLLRVRLL